MLTPSKQFDFTTAVLSPSVTFARAGAAATRVNSSGYIESVTGLSPADLAAIRAELHAELTAIFQIQTKVDAAL